MAVYDYQWLEVATSGYIQITYIYIYNTFGYMIVGGYTYCLRGYIKGHSWLKHCEKVSGL